MGRRDWPLRRPACGMRPLADGRTGPVVGHWAPSSDAPRAKPTNADFFPRRPRTPACSSIHDAGNLARRASAFARPPASTPGPRMAPSQSGIGRRRLRRRPPRRLGGPKKAWPHPKSSAQAPPAGPSSAPRGLCSRGGFPAAAAGLPGGRRMNEPFSKACCLIA